MVPDQRSALLALGVVDETDGAAPVDVDVPRRRWQRVDPRRAGGRAGPGGVGDATHQHVELRRPVRRHPRRLVLAEADLDAGGLGRRGGAAGGGDLERRPLVVAESQHGPPRCRPAERRRRRVADHVRAPPLCPAPQRDAQVRVRPDVVADGHASRWVASPEMDPRGCAHARRRPTPRAGSRGGRRRASRLVDDHDGAGQRSRRRGTRCVVQVGGARRCAAAPRGGATSASRLRRSGQAQPLVEVGHERRPIWGRAAQASNAAPPL